MIPHKTLYTKFLGFIIKKGNITSAKKILNSTLLIVSKRLKIFIHKVVLYIFKKLNCFIETRRIKIKRGSHTIPFSINFRRRTYLIVMWVIQAIKADKRKCSKSKKLSSEFIKILRGINSISLKIKENNKKQALLNRSNIHYRW